jgi:hypothetical protein
MPGNRQEREERYKVDADMEVAVERSGEREGTDEDMERI